MVVRVPVFLGIDSFGSRHWNSCRNLRETEIHRLLEEVTSSLQAQDKAFERLATLPLSLDQHGWGIVFPKEVNPSVVEALRPLIEARRLEAHEGCRVFGKQDGYQQGESAAGFVSRRAGRKVSFPYHLLLVGDFEQIPLVFQLELGIRFSVGRLNFEAVADYRQYAEKISLQKVSSQRPRVSFFGTAHEDDYATALTSWRLIRPLGRRIGRFLDTRGFSWELDIRLGREACKDRQLQSLQGSRSAALMVTCGHTVVGKLGELRHGDLICGDGSPRVEVADGKGTLSSRDVKNFETAQESIVFRFGSFSAGCFYEAGLEFLGHLTQRQLGADCEEVASLNRNLLAKAGGASAILALSGMSEVTCFGIPGGERLVGIYANTIRRLIAGAATGEALSAQTRELVALGCQAMEGTTHASEDPYYRGWHRLSLLLGVHCGRRFVLLGDPWVKILV